MRHRTRGVFLLATAALLVPAEPALGQDRTSSSPPIQTTWRFSGGPAWFGLRDVARTSIPVDASPLTWRGHGLGFEIARTRDSGRWLTRMEAGGVFIGGFEYRSNLRATARPEADRHRAVLGRFEWRRMFGRDRWIRGLAFGVGLETLGGYATDVRHLLGGLQVNESALSAGVAGAATVRLQRWSKVRAELTWSNGLSLARLRERHDGGAASTSPHYGGGWLTTFSAETAWRLSPATSLVVRYTSTGDSLFSSHRYALTSYGGVSAGVTYAR